MSALGRGPDGGAEVSLVHRVEKHSIVFHWINRTAGREPSLARSVSFPRAILSQKRVFPRGEPRRLTEMGLANPAARADADAADADRARQMGSIRPSVRPSALDGLAAAAAACGRAAG